VYIQEKKPTVKRGQMLEAETEANTLASGLEALLSAVIPHFVLDYWPWLFGDHVTAPV